MRRAFAACPRAKESRPGLRSRAGELGFVCHAYHAARLQSECQRKPRVSRKKKAGQDFGSRAGKVNVRFKRFHSGSDVTLRACQ